jgi:hypothetical protein
MWQQEHPRMLQQLLLSMHGLLRETRRQAALPMTLLRTRQWRMQRPRRVRRAVGRV